MNKMFFIVVVLLVFFSKVLAQEENFVGIYRDEVGRELHVKDNSIFFVMPQSSNAIAYESDTLAICTFSKVEKDIIELNTQDPKELIQSTMKISQKYDSLTSNKKQIIFNIPCQNDLLIEILTNDYKFLRLDYSANNNSICLPEQTQKVFYSVELKRVLMPHDVNGAFYGIIRYTSKDIEFEKDKNTIIVSLPGMTCSFFERYYVKGEYARIVGNTIIWKGRTFIKDE